MTTSEQHLSHSAGTVSYEVLAAKRVLENGKKWPKTIIGRNSVAGTSMNESISCAPSETSTALRSVAVCNNKSIEQLVDGCVQKGLATLCPCLAFQQSSTIHFVGDDRYLDLDVATNVATFLLLSLQKQ